MSVLKCKRNESKFEVFHHARKIRKETTELALRNFGYKPKERLHETEAQRERRFALEAWFIKDEQEHVIGILRSLMRHIRTANRIHPTIMEEYTERRLHQDLALADCDTLLEELEYVAETVSTDINKLTRFAEYLLREIGLIKAWRKSDNKYLKAIKNTEE